MLKTSQEPAAKREHGSDRPPLILRQHEPVEIAIVNRSKQATAIIGTASNSKATRDNGTPVQWRALAKDAVDLPP